MVLSTQHQYLSIVDVPAKPAAGARLWSGSRPNGTRDESLAKSAIRVTWATNALTDILIFIAINHETTFVVYLLSQVTRLN